MQSGDKTVVKGYGSYSGQFYPVEIIEVGERYIIACRTDTGTEEKFYKESGVMHGLRDKHTGWKLKIFAADPLPRKRYVALLSVAVEYISESEIQVSIGQHPFCVLTQKRAMWWLPKEYQLKEEGTNKGFPTVEDCVTALLQITGYTRGNERIKL